MAELTQEQLLLLNNLMYYNSSGNEVTVEDIAEDIKNNLDLKNLSGGFEHHPERMQEIADAILSDKELCSLQIRGSTEANSISAKCFVDPDTNEATIAIRGTGGSYDAWKDNVEGGYETDTTCQKTIDSFVKEMGNKYDDITITGHSKGGNLAQYATVKNGDEIVRCVSFDGQGFNNDFVDANQAEIDANRDKIISVNAHNDFVNILLNPIAGKTVYLNNDADGMDAHSSYCLWASNKHKIDEQGNYYPPVEQDQKIKELQRSLKAITDEIDSDMPDYAQKALYSLLGAIIGAYMDNELSEDEALDFLTTYLKFVWNLGWYNTINKLIKAAYSGDIKSVSTLISLLRRYLNEHKEQTQGTVSRSRKSTSSAGKSQFTVKPSQLINVTEDMRSMYKMLSQISADIESVDYIEVKEVKKAINKISSHLTDTSRGIFAMTDALKKISKLYNNCETAIANYRQ